jgi:hypothetical protein
MIVVACILEYKKTRYSIIKLEYLQRAPFCVHRASRRALQKTSHPSILDCVRVHAPLAPGPLHLIVFKSHCNYEVRYVLNSSDNSSPDTSLLVH